MDRKISLDASEELVEEIDKQRARDAAETGDIEARTVWIRDAIREKLGIDYGDDNAEAQTGAV